jgi:hypothetical protein
MSLPEPKVVRQALFGWAFNPELLAAVRRHS